MFSYSTNFLISNHLDQLFWTDGSGNVFEYDKNKKDNDNPNYIPSNKEIVDSILNG